MPKKIDQRTGAKNRTSVILFDVDNVLLDDDRFLADFRTLTEKDFGQSESERYWEIVKKIQDERGYADYLGALQAFRDGLPDHPKLLEVSTFVLGYPFQDRVFPLALEAVEALKSFGTTVILSDGDMAYQPWKLHRAGIWEAFEGRILVRIHKQDELPALRKRFPATHYVMVDDKLNILSKMKLELKSNITTVFMRQGQHADKQQSKAVSPAPDVTVENIADLLGLDWARMVAH